VLKATGHKVGLAEVSIQLIHETARVMKAGVRAKYGHLPLNQLNMDLCMGSIAVLNRIPKHDQSETPYEIFTGTNIDFISDFCVE
jgi:hypothetical protein